MYGGRDLIYMTDQLSTQLAVPPSARTKPKPQFHDQIDPDQGTGRQAQADNPVIEVASPRVNSEANMRKYCANTAHCCLACAKFRTVDGVSVINSE